MTLLHECQDIFTSILTDLIKNPHTSQFLTLLVMKKKKKRVWCECIKTVKSCWQQMCSDTFMTIDWLLNPASARSQIWFFKTWILLRWFLNHFRKRKQLWTTHTESMKIRSLLKNHVRNNQQESVSVNRYCIALSFKIHFVQNLCNWSEVSVASSSLSAKVAHGKMAREAGILEFIPQNLSPSKCNALSSVKAQSLV